MKRVLSCVLIALLSFSTFSFLAMIGCAQGVSYKIAVVGLSYFNTVRDDLDELIVEGKVDGYDLYTEANIDNLWVKLSQYQILIIDEDCMFDWDNPGPDHNKPTPVLPIGVSFYNHEDELKQWIYNGGGLFSTDQNDISFDVPVPEPWTEAGNVWWTWLPDELQVESNEFPSNYPEIGYGHDPWNLEVIYDPGIFSYPNKIDVTKVAKDEAHGRFTNYAGYTALVRDKSNGDILEVYRTYGSGVIVLSHLEYETADPWDVDYVENELYLISPARKNIGLTLYIEDAVKGQDEAAAPLVNKAPGDKIDIVAAVANNEKDPYDVDVVFEVPSDLSFVKAFTRYDFCDIDEKPVTPTIDSNKYKVTISLESGKSKQVVLRFDISESALTTVCPLVFARTIVEGVVCSSAITMYNMVDNVKAIIVTNRHLLIQRYGLDERIDKALHWAFSKLDSTEYPYECLRFVEDAYADAGSDPRNNIPIPEDVGVRYAKYVANFLGVEDTVSIPPRGAFVFYDWTGWVDLNNNKVKDEGEVRNWGHVGLSLGDGNVIHALAKVQINTIQEMEEISVQGDKLKYIGWAWPPLTPPICYRFSEELLSFLYKISDWREENCIIYYVDHYDESLKKWNQSVDYTDETTANRIANRIDDLIEKWSKKTNPPFLMIVGGDEIIPFYRYNDPTDDELGWVDDPGTNPRLIAASHDYYFTDNPYGDIEGDDWQRGDLEISIGRILGASAKTMKKIIERGVGVPEDSGNAVLSSCSGWELGLEPDDGNPTNIRDFCNVTDLFINRGYEVKNDEETPRTIDADDWRESDLQKIANEGMDVFMIGGHADYYVAYLPHGDQFMISDIDGGFTEFDDSNPVVLITGCHGGAAVPDPEGGPDTDLVYGLIENGATIYIGAQGYSYGSPSNYQRCTWGERLIQMFFSELLKQTKNTLEIGQAMKNAKSNFEFGVGGDDNIDLKTVTEFVVYGVPWHILKYRRGTMSSSIYGMKNSVNLGQQTAIVQSGPQVFTMNVEVTIPSYVVTQENGYDIISIGGQELDLSDGYPILPYIKAYWLPLPPSAEITDVQVISNTSYAVGPYNIPIVQVEPFTVGGISYTNETKMNYFYPTEIVFYEKISNGVQFYVCPIQHNPTTDDTIFYDYVNFQITYKTPTPIVITEFSTDKQSYVTAEEISSTVSVVNIGSDMMHDLYVNLAIRDSHGQAVALASSAPFDLNSGEIKEISILLDQKLPHGTYLLEAEVTGSRTLATSSKYIKIISGGIVNFYAPSEVKSGDEITFEISFMNGKLVDVSGEFVIYIYDPHGIEIAELHSLPTTFSANSTTRTNITWSTVGREYGTYTASAMVYAGDESFGPVYLTFTIKPPDQIPPTTTLTIGDPKYIDPMNNTYVTSVTPFTLIAEDNPGGMGVASTFYRIYNSTYDTGWLEYSAPFYLTGLFDGEYSIDYYSVDNAQNSETINTVNIILFSWNYIFEDTYGRGTILKINLAHKFFQFVAPDKDYGIRIATYMQQCGRAVVLRHFDGELRLITVAVDTRLDLCITVAWDFPAHKQYLLIDRAGFESSVKSLKFPFFIKFSFE